LDSTTKNKGNSRAVESGQTGIHPHLEAYLLKHLDSPWRQPLHPPSVTAFESVKQILANGPEQKTPGQNDLILDSGCGTGESTRIIASRYPQSVVIGIDRSRHRLEKTGHHGFPLRDANIIWVRAELETFWRLARKENWLLSRHYLFYPNPYPKSAQLQKRWHAHPVFPSLLALGGLIEMRCNWSIYAMEFARAIELVTGVETRHEEWQVKNPISAFERKYIASNHQLFRVIVPAGVL